jgi:NADPH:quinone reductase-like Zn-dependent oxidoreductase
LSHKSSRCVVIARHGPPEVLAPRNVQRPETTPGSVRIVVRAAGVNFADVLGRMGLYPDAPPLPFTPGYEVCGVVDAVGEGVSGVQTGDRVVAVTRFGGYASDVIVPAALVFPAPAGLSDVEAAALPVNYLTAWLALFRCANLQERETVLIHAAAGGVGIAATQLARLRNAVIIGVASTSKHGAIRTQGVSEALDGRVQAVGDAVRRLTAGRGADVILDSVGGRSFAESYRLLAPLGRLVLIGVSSIAPAMTRRWLSAARTVWTMPRFKALSLMNRNRGVFGINLGHLWGERTLLAHAAGELLGAVKDGRIRPVVAASFPLDRAADAHRFLQERRNVGKVVLTV